MEGIISINKGIVRFANGALTDDTDEIVTEFPLTILLDGEEFATMVCTPDNLEELVIGFLASEGIIRRKAEIQKLHIDTGKGFAYIDLANKTSANKNLHSKRFIGSCCGKSRQFYLYNDARTAKTSTSRIVVSPLKCIELMQNLQEGSTVFKETGGVHNAALCDENGLIKSFSDIGRHNALDKILGYCLMNSIPVKDKIIAFSGRISSEVLLKAAKIGVGIVLSKSAPTDLAIKLADDLNITAVGFIRGESFNVYSHPERIKSEQEGLNEQVQS